MWWATHKTCSSVITVHSRLYSSCERCLDTKKNLTRSLIYLFLRRRWSRSSCNLSRDRERKKNKLELISCHSAAAAAAAAHGGIQNGNDTAAQKQLNHENNEFITRVARAHELLICMIIVCVWLWYVFIFCHFFRNHFVALTFWVRMMSRRRNIETKSKNKSNECRMQSLDPARHRSIIIWVSNKTKPAITMRPMYNWAYMNERTNACNKEKY